MKYLLKNGKLLFSGTKKQIMEYVRTQYKDEFWVKENVQKFDIDYGVFKFSIEASGLEISDRIPKSEYNKKVLSQKRTNK